MAVKIQVTKDERKFLLELANPDTDPVLARGLAAISLPKGPDKIRSYQPRR
jgi:hypothetical protein